MAGDADNIYNLTTAEFGHHCVILPSWWTTLMDNVLNFPPQNLAF